MNVSPAVAKLLVPVSTVAERDARLEPKLVAAAHQFEASLMQELLKPLSGGSLFSGDEQGDKSGIGDLAPPAEGSGGALMSFSSEALARALSDKGGMGLARRVLDHFESGESGLPEGPLVEKNIGVREIKLSQDPLRY